MRDADLTSIEAENDTPETTDRKRESLLDRSLASLWAWNWEKTAWVALLLLAVVTRFADLESRSMSHDESEHAWFAYNLFTGKGYQHSPVYHGPFAYHVLALFYLIFGDSTLMARVPTALFGIAVILLCWQLRRWIGRLGAFLAASLITLSPALMQYSRHTRHDIYVIFWALLLIIAVFRYLEADSRRASAWLFVAAASLSLALAVKEVAFIYGATLGAFVVLIIANRWLGGQKDAESAQGEPVAGREIPVRLSRRDWQVLFGVALLSLAGTLLFRLLNPVLSSGDPAGVSQIILLLLVVALPPLAAIGLASWHVSGREVRESATAPSFSTATDMAVVLATLILPWLSPFLIALLGYDPLDYSFPAGVLPSLSVLLGLAGFAVAIGLLWDVRRWLIAAGLFYGIFLLFFTTFFTNGQGFATGIVGSLGYWLSQQEVARGGQPWYYYLLVVPLYEFLPIVLSVPVVLATLLRRNRVTGLSLMVALVLLVGAVAARLAAGPAATDTLLVTLSKALVAFGLILLLLAAGWGEISRQNGTRRYFLSFLSFWILSNWFAYTAAGEKMPWLTTHITLPMCIAGGWWLGRTIEGIDWRDILRRGGLWIALLIVPLIASLLALLTSRPFQDRTIPGLSETTQWLAALVMGTILVVLLVRQSRRVGWPAAGRVAGLTLVLLLGLWTVRTTYMLNFINYDNVSEFLFYAHASPDPQTVMDELEDISRRTAGDKQLKVSFDDDSSWPFNWYLRDWPNAVYFGANPSRESLDVPVAIVGSKNLDKARPYVQRDYNEFNYRLIWWPQEGYKDLSLDRIRRGITDPAKRREFLDVLIWRRYPTPLAEWPLVHRFSLFVRKDLAAELWDFGSQPVMAAAFVDPYEQGFQELSSLRQVGSAGSGPGQLTLPRNMAVAADGTLFVADSGNHRIQVFDPQGNFLREWGSSCEVYLDDRPGCVDPDGNGPLQVGDGQMREPWGIAVGPQGYVYVADTWNHRILLFDQEGTFLDKWGTFVSTDGQATGSPGAFWGPRALAIDGAGNLYVTDTGNKRVQVFGAEGNFLAQFGGGGVIEGRFDEPVGLALLPAGEGLPGGTLFVADAWNQRVQVLDVTFQEGLPRFIYTREWSIEGWIGQSVVNKPYLAVTQAGTVYVTDPEGWRVLVFDEGGNFKATFGQYGTDNQGFTLPTGIAIGPDGNVYVADADNNRVMVFPLLAE